MVMVIGTIVASPYRRYADFPFEESRLALGSPRMACGPELRPVSRHERGVLAVVGVPEWIHVIGVAGGTMPLRAVVNGKDVLAPLLDDDAWADLRAAVKAGKKMITLPCCQSEGRMRVSKLGTKHFFHKPNVECDWEPETVQHLKAKAEIALACQRAGYEVSTEVTGADWRADVLATKGRARVAFEVQWSAQTVEETAARQRRYSRDGVRTCWFFRKPPTQQATIDLPIFGISSDEGAAMTAHLSLESSFPLNDWGDRDYHPLGDGVSSHREEYESDWSLGRAEKSLPLAQLVEKLLTRQVKFCHTAAMRRTDYLRVRFLKTPCWKCKRWSNFILVEESHVFASGCGLELREDFHGTHNMVDRALRSDVQDLVRPFLATPAGKQIKMAPIKPRYSKTAGERYLSFGCFWCDAIFGEWFLPEMVAEAMYSPEQGISATLERTPRHSKPARLEIGHWCLPEGNAFCEL